MKVYLKAKAAGEQIGCATATTTEPTSPTLDLVKGMAKSRTLVALFRERWRIRQFYFD
jgi:hypothetical protein